MRATIIALIAAMAIALPFTFLAPSTASAADGTDGGALEITSSQLAKTTIVETEGVQLTLEFRVPDNAFHAGDTSTIQLPAGFVFYSDSTFDVTSSTGVTVAHATVTRDASTMTMTYTDYVDDHSNITGSLHFTFKMDPNNEPAQGDHPFDLLVDNKPVDCGTITVGQMQGDDPNETFAKYGWQDTSTPDEIQYAMRVNGAGIDMHDVTLTDTLETRPRHTFPRASRSSSATSRSTTKATISSRTSRTSPTNAPEPSPTTGAASPSRCPTCPARAPSCCTR